MMEEKYAELEKRVQVLEELLKGFLQSEDNNINFTLKDCSINNLNAGDECDVRSDNCSVGNLCFGDGCDIKQNNCPIGTMIPGDIDTADGQLDDIESRIDELNNEIDLIENRIDDVANMDEEL
ncbi:hypothetical protein [Butyrivibrio proteoclasticus]|uniref:hypothetical protein n=1 Tax=Butyrivibrio proteoclasticus TaxID=43305 RepID=UPI0012DE09F4|nr:hypothetical protein [Butyrivibrio proteoclasticus]